MKKTKENSNSHSINKSPINLNSNYQPGNNDYVDRPIPILNNHYNQTLNNGFNGKAVNINANQAHSALDSHTYNQQQLNAINSIKQNQNQILMQSTNGKTAQQPNLQQQQAVSSSAGGSKQGNSSSHHAQSQSVPQQPPPPEKQVRDF